MVVVWGLTCIWHGGVLVEKNVFEMSVGFRRVHGTCFCCGRDIC